MNSNHHSEIKEIVIQVSRKIRNFMALMMYIIDRIAYAITVVVISDTFQYGGPVQ